MNFSTLVLDESVLGTGVPAAFKEALAEVDRQNNKWGASRKQHPLEWNAILMEEVGEAATNIVDGHFMADPDKTPIEYLKAAEELVQVAAVALQAVASIRSQYKEPAQYAQYKRLVAKGRQACAMGKTSEARQAIEKYGTLRTTKLDPKHYDEYEQELDNIINGKTKN